MHLIFRFSIFVLNATGLFITECIKKPEDTNFIENFKHFVSFKDIAISSEEYIRKAFYKLMTLKQMWFPMKIRIHVFIVTAIIKDYKNKFKKYVIRSFYSAYFLHFSQWTHQNQFCVWPRTGLQQDILGELFWSGLTQ